MAKSEIVKFEDRNFLPIKQGVKKTIEMIQGAVGGKGLTWRNFERAVNPASGEAQWKMEDLDGSMTRFNDVEGIVIFHKMTRSYWKTKFKGGGTPPDCASEDGLEGVGNPGGTCSKCPFSKFGSGENNSQACRQIKQLFLLREGEILPVLINLSPINSEKATTFFLRLLSRKQLAFNQVITKITMSPDKSNSGYDYGDVKMAMVEQIPPEASDQIEGLTDMFTEHLADTLGATLNDDEETSQEPDPPVPDF